MRDMTNIGFPARPQPTPVPLTTGPEQPAPHSKRGGASRSTSPSTIAALPGVIAVLATGGGPDHRINVAEPWHFALDDAASLSRIGDVTTHVDDHFGLRALTRGEWSLAVVFHDDSPISKSLIRAMRTCLENLNAGLVKP